MSKIEVVGKKEFDMADELEMPLDVRRPSEVKLFTKEDLAVIQTGMEQPVKYQKELAAKLKLFLDQQIDKEMSEKGFLSEYTRRWVKEYNTLLDGLEKNLHGDKSVSLHLHKVTHAHIGDLMRKHKNISPNKNETTNRKDNAGAQEED